MMIEQYGAAMLTEEMVALVDFITENKQEQGEQALEVMLRAVLQLPDYLEHIQSGHRDIPIAILPLFFRIDFMGYQYRIRSSPI